MRNLRVVQTFNLPTMKRFALFCFAMMTCLVSFGQISYLQYRHVPADQVDKFVERETKHWSKVAESAIKKGQMKSWSLWKKVGTTSADEETPNFVIVNTYESLENMDPNKVWSDNMDALGSTKAEDVETMSFAKVTFDYYIQLEDRIDGKYSYALVNYAKPTDIAAFIQENKTLWKPVHQASIENILNGMSYWSMSSVIYPTGNKGRFTVFTVDGFTKLNDALDYLRFTETSANSDNSAAWNDILDKTKMDELTPDGFEMRIIYERVMTVD